MATTDPQRLSFYANVDAHRYRARGRRTNAKGKTTAVDLDPRLPGAETTIESYADCPHGSVQLWTVRGGGHQVATPAMLARVGDFLASNPKLPKLSKTPTKKKRKR